MSLWDRKTGQCSQLWKT